MAAKPSTGAPANDTSRSRIQSAREKTSALAGRVGDSARQTGEQIAGNPAAIIASGLAVGAILGLLIPIGRREKDLLAPLGARAADLARDATSQAVEQGRSKLNEVAGQFVSHVSDAVSEAVGTNDDD